MRRVTVEIIKDCKVAGNDQKVGAVLPRLDGQTADKLISRGLAKKYTGRAKVADKKAEDQ